MVNSSTLKYALTRMLTLYQWLKDIETDSIKSFAPLQVTNLPDDTIETIFIIYENFTIQLPVHIDASYIRSILGC